MCDMLELKEVETYINQFHILHGINLKVRKNAATVILGRNGAGKTTTLETIIGLKSVKCGCKYFDGKDITKLKDYEVPRLGIGYVPEDRGIFGELTVEENLIIASRNRNDYFSRLDLIINIFPDIKKYFKHKSKVLSGGQAQMLSISRALINNNKIILIDEPSKGLAPLIIEKLVTNINLIKKDNTILMVEQNFEMAIEIGDYFYIIDNGRTVFECGKNELLSNEEIKTKYLGIG